MHVLVDNDDGTGGGIVQTSHGIRGFPKKPSGIGGDIVLGGQINVIAIFV